MKHFKRILASVLAFMVVFTSVGLAAVKKDESVYVVLSSKGETKDVIVSDWIHSDDVNIEIRDRSILDNVVNVKGDEVPKKEGETLVWTLQNNDIFYQGTTKKKLPLEVTINYYLNGQKIEPKDLAGKSGKVKIELDFKNNDEHLVKIDGDYKKVFTPFTVVAVVNLPLDNFKNVKLSSGEVFSDGNNQVVTFITFPGLKESLNLKGDLLDISDKLIIEADAQKFKLSPIMITATPKMVNIDKIEGADNVNELIDGIKKIKEATEKLNDGSKKLAEGSKELYNNMNKLTDGLDKLSSASKDVKDGIQRIAGGAKGAYEGSAKLNEGLGKLKDGISGIEGGLNGFADGTLSYAENAKKFADGAVKFSEGAMSLSENTKTLENGLEDIVKATEEIKNGENSIVQGAGKSLEGIRKLKEAKEKENSYYGLLIKGIDSLKGLVSLLSNIPGTSSIVDKLNAGLEEQRNYLQAMLKSGEEYVKALEELEKGIYAIKTGTENLNNALQALNEGQRKALNGAKKISGAGETLKGYADEMQKGSLGLKDGAVRLQKGAEDLSGGLKKIVPSVTALYEGSNNLKNGLDELSKGSEKLYSGYDEFSKGIDTAKEGSIKLTEGAKKLSDGLDEFDKNFTKYREEGINKMDSEVSSKFGDINEILKRKDEVVRLSKSYGTFSGLSKDMEGSVKFIMRTEEIKYNEVEEVSQTKVIKENKNIFERFVDYLKKIF
ncbi:MAG: hypothetical protein N2486_06745 [Caloramator sp.]|nr:hypothetical protein [Caloramator sp.]